MRLLLLIACTIATPACHRGPPEPHADGEIASFGKLGASVHTRGLVARGDGRLILVGDAYGDVDLGGEAVHGGTSRDPATFVAALDDDGKVRWVYRVAGQCVDARVAVHEQQTAIAGSCTEPDGRGHVHVFVAMLDNVGREIWSKRAGEKASVHGITFDPAGNVVVAGQFFDTISFGGTTETFTAHEIDGFILSIDPRGQPRWVKTFPHADVQAVANTSGEILLAGSFHRETAIGGTTLTADNGGRFLARMSFDGEVHAAFVVAPGTLASLDQGIAVPSAGAPVLAYDSLDGITLASVSTTATPLVTIAYGKNATSRDTALGRSVRNVSFAPDGTLVLAGTFQRPLDLGAGAIQPVGFDDAFIARYTADGKLLGVKVIATQGQDELGGIAINSKGVIFAATHAEHGPPGKPYRDLLVSEVYYAATVQRVKL